MGGGNSWTFQNGGLRKTLAKYINSFSWQTKFEIGLD